MGVPPGVMAARDSSIARLSIGALYDADKVNDASSSDDVAEAVQQCFARTPSHPAYVACLQVIFCLGAHDHPYLARMLLLSLAQRTSMYFKHIMRGKHTSRVEISSCSNGITPFPQGPCRPL